MDLICPYCRGDLQRTTGGWAVCAQHGGNYEVLFDRSAPVATVVEASVCKQHPARAAVASCPACGTAVCTTCSFDVYGKTYCGDCAIDQANAVNSARAVPGNFTASGGMLNLAAAAAAYPHEREPFSGKCKDHPEVDAVAMCRLCSSYVCTTCDFALPGNVHLCPSCVEKQSTEDVSPKRKKLSYIAIACATWSTILFVLLFVGAFNSMFQDPETGKVADLFITNIILWPLLVGVGISLSALDGKLKNTALMKAAAWWNGILGGIFLIVVIAANLGFIK